MKRVEPISIEFTDNQTPYSPFHQDVYFSIKDGIEESNYVYLEGSGFAESLKNRSKIHFNIGEIGFGVGLNFLLTYRHFINNSDENQSLTYFSVENHPVRLDGLKKLYSQFPDLSKYAEELFEQYPVLTPGIHSLSFADGRVRLLLLLGDAQEMFSKLKLTENQKIAFWYWDGFAPTKNPDAFQDTLFNSLIEISTHDAQAASFTAAGWVRRGLENIGFKIEKRMGFGNKRECIHVFFPESRKEFKNQKPWFSHEKIKTLAVGDTVAVVGAGLSGTAIARALAQRGFHIRLIEQESIAAHASGNPVGLYNVQLSKIPNPISRFSQLSLTYFLRELKTHELNTKSGILRQDAVTARNDFEIALNTSDYPSDFFESCDQGYYFPMCGILNPRKLCEARSMHPLIQIIKAKVSNVEKNENGFNLIDENKQVITHCSQIVYATGSSQVLDRYLSHPLLKTLPTKPVRGQVVFVKPNSESKTISHTLQDAGYLTPLAPEITDRSFHCIGATYHAKPVHENQSALDTNALLKEAGNKHPAFSTLTENDVLGIRIGYRLSTPDKLPLIGPLVDPEKMKLLYGKALRDGRVRDLPALNPEYGEWIFLGMSSRGITFSSYGAEILASLMCGEALPVEDDLWEHLHSARFIVRNLKKS